jgi:hypothetical protein
MADAPGFVRATALLTRTEIVRLARTEQVYRYFLVPTLVGIPVSLMIAVLVASFGSEKGRVAVPLGLSTDLAIVAALEAEKLTVVPAADPEQMWASGHVDAAIVSVSRGDGIGARRELELATREAWILEVASDDRGVSDAIAEAAEAAAAETFDALVVLAGGSPGDARVATVETLPFEKESRLGFDLPRGLRAYALVGLGAMSMFFLTLPMVADRREGLTETFRALPTPITAVLWSRTLAVTLLQVLGAALIVLNFLLLLPMLGKGFVAPPIAAEIPGLVAGLIATNSLFVAVGVVSPTPKAANNTSSLAMMVQLGLLLLGVFGPPLAFVPLTGVVSANTAVERGVAVVSTLAFASVVLAICGHLLHTRVRMVLPRETA